MNLPPPPILFAEDSDLDIEMTLEAFAAHGIVNPIVTVRDGNEALDYLRCAGRFAMRPPGDPALVLLDLNMPKVDGLEVLRAIRGDRHLRLLPVVVLTSSRAEQDMVVSYELGANAYVVKPVGFAEFAEAARQLGVFWAIHNRRTPHQGGAAG